MHRQEPHADGYTVRLLPPMLLLLPLLASHTRSVCVCAYDSLGL